MTNFFSQKYGWYISIISNLIFLFSCSNATNLGKSKIDLTLVDSINNSAQLVSVQMCQLHDEYVAYVAGEKETMEVYSINKAGDLEFLEQYEISNNYGGVRALTKVKIKDTNLLLLGNKADNALEVHKINEDGKTEKMSAVYDSDSTFIDEIVTIQSVNINHRHFIYAGGLDKGLSCFELSEHGELHHIQSIADDESLFLHGIIGMSSVVMENNRFLLTGAFFDGGISCFQIMENGQLDNVSNVKDNKTMFLNGTFAVNTVQLGNQHFLLVGHRHNVHYATENAEQHYHGDGINVFKIDGKGQINLHTLLKDDEELLLKGSTRIEILQVNEEKAFVFIGTRDDKGVQICSLGQDGVLKPIEKLDLDYAIYNGMSVKNIDDKWYLLIGAYDKNLLEMYFVDFDF